MIIIIILSVINNFTLDFDFIGLSLPIIGAMISQYL